MAFPTSPSNNQVHKEGNRSFVYDSTAGVWDQVKEPARTEVHGVQGGAIDPSVKFPPGHMCEVNHILRIKNSGNYEGGTLGGTGFQIIPLTDIKIPAGQPQNVLTLSSNLFTLKAGYYTWDFHRPVYAVEHALLDGIMSYGAPDGTGTYLTDRTKANVNFGSTVYYFSQNSPGIGGHTADSGFLWVTSENQKYGIYASAQVNSGHGYGGFGACRVDRENIQANLRLMKIG